jgi:ankyrin repeat protein
MLKLCAFNPYDLNLVPCILISRACESGVNGVVRILLENGADGRIHPVTKYSPLYIAAYHGHKEILNQLLDVSFP